MLYWSKICEIKSKCKFNLHFTFGIININAENSSQHLTKNFQVAQCKPENKGSKNPIRVGRHANK